jgi:hypothetical protein
VIVVYQLGAFATAIALVLLEHDRHLSTIFLLSLVWPLWLLAMIQESVECLEGD